jgi:peroxiredoxin
MSSIIGKRLEVGDIAPDLALRDGDGTLRRLSALYGEGPVVLLFLRHFG